MRAENTGRISQAFPSCTANLACMVFPLDCLSDIMKSSCATETDTALPTFRCLGSSLLYRCCCIWQLTVPLFRSWSSLRSYEALRSLINTLLALVFFYATKMFVFIQFCCTQNILIFPANFTSAHSVEMPVSHSLRLCIWRRI